MRVKQQTIGVTGAAGFIGSHLCEKLISNGCKVIAVDNLSKGTKENIRELFKNKNFKFYKADITDPKTAKKLFSNLDIVVHLAAAKIPRYGGRLETLNVNTEGTKNILEAIKNHKTKLIFASTSDVYGKNPKLPFAEDSNLVIGSSEVARWSYAISKIFDEQLCFAYWEEYQVPFVILRLFGVYGPKQHRTWWGGPQAIFIDKVIRGKEIEIHGDGRQIRTFVYIDDVVDAFIKSISNTNINNQIINIGTTEEVSIIELGKLISQLIKKPLKTKKIPYESFTGQKYEDVQRKKPAIKKAEKLLKWRPKVNLREGLLETINWHLKNT